MVIWRLYQDFYEGYISIIYQELSVINELSILENLFVGKLPSSVEQALWMIKVRSREL